MKCFKVGLPGHQTSKISKKLNEKNHPSVTDREDVTQSQLLRRLKMDFNSKFSFSSIKATLAFHHHHHHAVLPARISMALSRHFSLSFIASGRSSTLHPLSSQSCCMYVRAGRLTFARPYMGVHRITSLMSSSLFHQQ